MRHNGTKAIKYNHTLSGNVDLSTQVAADLVGERGPLYEYIQKNGFSIGIVTISNDILGGSRMQISKDWQSVLLVKLDETPVAIEAKLEDHKPIVETIIALSGLPSQKHKFAFNTDCMTPELLGYGSWL